MKLIESSVEFLKQEDGLDGMKKHIESCGRTCYKSEEKIKEGSAEKFVNAMIKSHHGAMLEHGTVYLAMPMETIIPIEANGWGKYYKNPYSKSGIICNVNGEQRVAAITNYRVLVENGWLDDLQYICEPTEYHEKRYTLRIVCDRGVTHELVRHRTFSFAQESSRYCNYGDDKKFGKELTFISPSWFDYEEAVKCYETFISLTEAQQHSVINMIYDGNKANDLSEGEEEEAQRMRNELMMMYDMMLSEKIYMHLIENGYQPQQARHVLPTMIKSEICMTGFASDWRFFFDLRLFGKTGQPHPDMLRIAQLAKEEFEKNGVWDDIMSHKSKFDE